MASINGLCVKHMKKFTGHEGEPCYQGDLYLGKVKIGYWSQDPWGCVVDNFNPEHGISKDLLNSEIQKLNEDKRVSGISSFDGEPFKRDYELTQLMTDYLSLLEDEKLFKRLQKRGYPLTLAITDKYNVWVYGLPEEFADATDEVICKVYADEIAEAEKKKLFKDCKITTKVYRSLNDFKIGEPIKLEDITRKEEA